MPDTNIYTENPLFTAGVGEDVTATEEQMNEEYKNSPITFREKYGDALFNAYTQQAAALGKQASAEGAAAARSLGEAIQDSMINLGAGAFGGTVDLFAGLAGVGGALGSEKSKELAEWLSSGSQAIYEGADSWASSAQDAQKRAYAARQQALKNRTDRQRREDLANGTSEVVANARHIARNFFGGAGNILEDGGMFLNMGSQALGSMIPSWIASAGIGAAAKGLKAVAAKTVPDAVDTAVDVADASNKFTQYLAKSAPWMAASGAVEGGGAYAQQLQEGLSTPINTLVEHSPEFNSRVAELMKQDIPEPQAQEQARRDLAFAAAEQAGIRTAATAAITGALTAKLANPFRSGSQFTQRLGEGLTEPVEELLTEGATQYHQNIATRDFLNAKQDPFEGIGQSAAEGAVGGLGMTAFRASPDIVRDSITGIADLATNYKNRFSVGDIEEKTFNSVTSANRSAEAAKDVMPKTAQDSQTRNISAVNNDLEVYANEVFKKTKRSDGSTGYSVTSEELVNVLDQIQKDKEIVSSTKEGENAQLKKAKEDILSSLNEIEKGAQWHMRSMIKEQRKTYKKKADLSKQELLGEAEYFSSLASMNLDQAKKEFTRIPKNHQEQLQKGTFENKIIQTNLNRLFDRKPQEATAVKYTVKGVNANLSPELKAQGYTLKSSADNSSVFVSTPATSDIQGASPSTTQAASSTQQTAQKPSIEGISEYTDQEFADLGVNESFEQVPFEELTANPEQSPVLSNDGAKILSQRKNGEFYVERNGKAFRVPKDISDALINEGVAPEAVNAAYDRLLNVTSRSSKDVFKVSLGKDNFFTTEVIDGTLYAQDQSVPLTQDERDAFEDQETSVEEKREIVRQVLERTFDLTPSRHAETLDPAILEKQGYWYDPSDETVKPLATTEVKEKFNQAMGDGIASLMIPLTRPIALWEADSPIEAFSKFISSPKSFLETFRANKHTNVAVMAFKLFGSEEDLKRRKEMTPQENAQSFFERTLKEPENTANFDAHQPLATQLLSLINPKSFFALRFNNHFSLEEDSGTPEIWKKLIKNMDPKERERLEKKFKEIGLLAGIQWTSNIAHHPHMPNEQELQRLGIDPELFPASEQLLEGVIAEAALNDLGTIVRKMLGVGQNNNAKNEDFDGLIQYLAARVSRALIKSDIVKFSTPIKLESDQEIKVLRVHKDYKKILDKKGDILVAILDPEYKNTWSETPYDAKEHILHTKQKANPAAIAFIRRENAMEGRVNAPLYNLWKIAGHPQDYAERNVSPFLPSFIGGANEDNRGLYNGKTYESELGRQINARLAFEQLEEIDIAAQSTGRAVDEVPIFYENAEAKNARVMQLGAATPQSNKFLRVAIVYADDSHVDLTDEVQLRAWKLAVGQGLGLKVSDLNANEVLKKVDGFIEQFKKIADKNKKDFDDFSAMIQGIAPDPVETTESKRNRKKEGYKPKYRAYDEIVQALIDEVNVSNKDTGLGVTDVYGMNALVELTRYIKTSEGDLKNFTSNVFLEIDGKNDGPSNINSFLAIAMGSFTPEWAQTSFRTGNFHGVNASTQSALTPGSMVSDVLGTKGNDLHKEVANEKVPEKVKLRMYNAVNTLRDKNKTNTQKQQAKMFLYVLHHIIELNRLLGKVSFNPIELVYINDGENKKLSSARLVSSKDPLAFDREVSKVLTTIIPYGSAVKGSSRNLIGSLMDEVCQDISNNLKKIALDPASFGGQEEPKMVFLKELLKVKYNPSTGTFEWAGNTASLVKHLYTQYPSKEALNTEGQVQDNMIGKYDKDAQEFIEYKTLQNFSLTPQGFDHLTDLFMPVFGEPAHSAVTEALGNDAMRGAKSFAIMSEMLTIVSQAIEQEELANAGGNFGSLTQKELYDVQRRIDRFSPRYDFPSGATAFIRKESYVASDEATMTDPETGLIFRPTSPRIVSSGVSGSPLAVQAMGDASNILYYGSLLQRDEYKNVLKVFDGVYVHPKVLELMSVLLNESTSMAQRQLVFKTMQKTKDKIAKQLKKRYNLSSAWSNDKVLQYCVSNYLSGKTMDGKVRGGDKTQQEELYKRLHASIQDFFNPKDFEEDMNQLRKDSLGGRVHKRSYKTDEGNIKIQLEEDFDNFLKELEVITLNEKIQHEALDAIPKAVHHMSGGESVYHYKDPISISKAKKILEDYNKKPGVKPFKNFGELLAAFLNRFVREEIYPKYEKDLSEDQKTRWLRLTKRDQGNTGYVELTDDSIYNELKGLFSVETKEPFRSQNKDGTLTEVSKDIISTAFSAIGKNRKPESVYRTLYGKLRNILPENTRVFFAGSVSALPEKVRNKFTHPQQKAIFVQENGESRIYVLDDSTAYDAQQIPTAELIAHEAIHAAIGHLIQLYYNGSGVLTNEQRKAVANLERLLEDFMNEDAWQGDTPVYQIIRLREILSNITDPAERLDEALAYICSNNRLFNAIADRHLKDDEPHRKGFWKLVKQVTETAHRVWRKLLNIITGSPMEQVLSYDTVYRQNFAKPMDFLELWGANTLILVNSEQQLDPNDRLKRRQQTKNVVRAATSVEPKKSFFRKSDFFKTLRSRMSSKVLFDTASQTGMFWGKNLSKEKVDQAYKEELAKILHYREEILSYAKNYLESPEDFADTVVSLMDRDAMPERDRYALFDLKEQLTDKLNEYSFIEDPNAATKEELNDSIEMYKLIKGTSSFYQRLEGLDMPDTFNPESLENCMFMALALTQSKVSNAIGKVDIETPAKKKINILNPLETLSNLSEQIISKWTRDLSNGKAVSDSIKIVLEEGEQLAQGTAIDNNAKGFFKEVDKFLGEAIATLTSLFSKDAGESLRETFSLINKFPSLGYIQTTELLRKQLNSFRSTKLAEAMKDVYGRTPSLTDVEVSFKQVKGYLDRWRKDTLEEDPELLKKEFKNHKITSHLKRFLHRTILRTGIYTLDEKVAEKVVTNEGELDLEIARVSDQIKNLSSEYYDLYIKKCRQLANYLTGNRQAGHNLLTSPEAIAHLLGETTIAMVDAPEGIVPLLGQMISLFSIKNFTDGDKAFMQDLFKTDKDAMLSMIRQYKTIIEEEKDKISQTKNKYYAHNYLFGWMPKGASATGRLVYVTRDQVGYFEKQGYTNLGRYQNSNIDPSEPIYRMYCKHPLEQEYQEGLFQGINQTSMGMLHKNLSRNEMEGTIVQNTDLYEDIYKNFDKESTGNGLIPIYDNDGFVIGYERSVMPEDRALIEDGLDFFSAMAQMRTRRERELAAIDINKDAVRMAWETYNNAPDDYKDKFIDVMHLDDPNIQKGLARLDWDTKSEIKKYFGDHLYLLADEVNTYLGYPRPKLTDLWDNSFFFPDGMQQQMVKCLEALLGKNALYKIGRAEEVLNIVTSYARDTIIIRSGLVAVMNALSNTLLLWLVFGVPLNKIPKYYTEAVAFTTEYNKLAKLHRELQFKANNATDPKEKASYEEKAKKIDKRIHQFPIYRLLKEGEYSTISAEGAEYEGANYAKSVIDSKFNEILNSIGKGDQIKSLLSNVLMTKNSMTYQTLNEFVNMSDWAAKLTGYWYLTEHSNKFGQYPMNHDMARNLVSVLFVDYDQLAGRARDWLNRTGLTWFLTYKYRMIAASLMVLHFNPSRTIMGTIFENVLPTNLFGGTPLSENLLAKVLSGDISYSVSWDMLFRGLLMHPAALFFGLLFI